MVQHSGFFCTRALSSYGLGTVQYSTSIFEVLQQAVWWFKFFVGKLCYVCSMLARNIWV